MNTVDGAEELEQLLKLAAGEIGRGAFESAREMCEEALARAPDDLDVLEMLGRVSMRQYRWQDAIELFDRVLRVRVDPWTLANLGNCYWKTADLDRAEYCLRGCLELEPGLAAARVSLATVLHAQHRFDEALKELDISASTLGADYQVESRRGCTLERLGKYDAAQEAFQRAVDLADRFVYPRQVAFDPVTWNAVCGNSAIESRPQLAFAAPGATEARGFVTLISCSPPYNRRIGVPFLRSYAEHAQAGGTLHIHIHDPDDGVVNEVRAAALQYELSNFVITTEQSPFATEQLTQRQAYYACGRLAHMEWCLSHYARPVLSLDIDFIVEGPLDGIVAAADEVDVVLNPRESIDSPWLDIISNIVVANPTSAARAYFAAVRNYMLALLEREPESTLVDQTAMYCVLAMARRYAKPPAVAWLSPEIVQGRLKHVGHGYYDLLNDPRYKQYFD